MRRSKEIWMERRRRQWQKQAARAKRRWHFAAFRRGKWSGRWMRGMQCYGYTGGKRRLYGLLWLFGFFVASLLSVLILLYTGKRKVLVTEENAVYSAEKDGWEREFFGLRFRIQDGEILIFQEKEERKRKK